MRLAIADPPYPLQVSERHDTATGIPRIVTRSRARRWYGDGPAGDRGGNYPADYHPDAGDWDDPARHRALLEQLLAEFDGWAIATSPDGLQVYGPLPVPHRLMVWAKTRPMPTAHRIATTWEPVIVYPPVGRRARPRHYVNDEERRGRGHSPWGYGPQVPDVLTCAPLNGRFAGAKPPRWTRWVLDALGYDPDVDELVDLFPGSGAVARAAAQGVLL